MEPVVGVFATRQEAEEATERLSERGLGQITLLTPDDWKEKVHTVRTKRRTQPSEIPASVYACGVTAINDRRYLLYLSFLNK